MRRLIVCLLLLLSATSAFAAGGVKLYGDLIFADGTRQTTATAQGAKGDVGAAGEAGASGYNSLILLSDEGFGANCANGGVKVQVGLDGNRNNVLDSNEVTQTKYMCASNSVNISVADYVKPVGYLRYYATPDNLNHTHYFDGVQSVNGHPVNLMREVDDPGSVLKETVYFSPDFTAGAYFLGANGTFFANPFPIALPTFVAGQEYGPYDIFGNGSTLVYVSWTFEDVTVPFGTYKNALKRKTRMRTGATDEISYNWHVKDIGSVKWQDAANPNDAEVLIERSFQ